MTEQLAHDPERDPQILAITRELCQQLNITNYDPTFVSWQVYAYENRRNPRNRKEFPPDDCLLEKYSVTLPGSMRERLEPGEWKPIIASSLIFSKKNATANLQWILASCHPIRCIGYPSGCGISSIVSSTIQFDSLRYPIHRSHRLNFWKRIGPNFGWTRNNLDWDDIG